MGYLLLSASLLACEVKGFCGKKQSGFISGTRDAVFLNLLRMLCCTAIGLFLTILQEGSAALAVNGATIAISLFSGISNAVLVITWLLSARGSAYMVLDIFPTAGIIVPMVFCWILFGEKIRLIQWAGFLLLLAAVCVMCSYSGKIKGKTMTPSDILLLILCGLSNGAADLSQKLFVYYCPEESNSAFNFYTYAFAAVILTLLFPFFRKGTASLCPVKKVWGYIVIMALCLFLASYFKTAAASLLPAAQMYPLFQGILIICSSLMASVFFRERMTKQSIAGMSMAFMALIIINL